MHLNMAIAVAKQVVLGKRCLLVVGTPQTAQQYYGAIGSLVAKVQRKAKGRGVPMTKGQILVLCTRENNGTEWKKLRFDCMEVDDEAMDYPAGPDLLHEASLRVVGDGTPSIVDKHGRPQWVTGFDKNGLPQ